MRTRELFDTVLHEAGLAIVSGDLAAGSRLKLVDVETRFGVSRTLARDILKIIEGLGLVRSRRRIGIEVLPRSEWRVLDPMVIAWRLESHDHTAQIASLTEVREAVEPVAARLAARNASSRQATRLVELAAELESLGASGLGLSPAYLAADLEFHGLLLTAGHNEMFAAMTGMVADVLRGRAQHGLTPAWPDLKAVADHSTIARAILARDADAAEAASRRQLSAVSAELRQDPDSVQPSAASAS